MERPIDLSGYLGDMSDAFAQAAQGRLDFVEEVMPHPPGWVKLNEREQLAQYMQKTPEEIRGMTAEHGTKKVREYVEKMEGLRGKYNAPY